jgi:hypothetical protein
VYYIFYILCIGFLLLPGCIEKQTVTIYEPELTDTEDPRIQQVTVKNNTLFKLSISRTEGCRYKIFHLLSQDNIQFIKHESSIHVDYFIFKTIKPGYAFIMFDRICPEWERKPRNQWPTDISKKQVNIIITQ